MYSPDEIRQILLWSQEYASLAPERFLLGRNSVPSKYKKAVAMQLRCARALASKLPHWTKIGVYIPEGINLEQASSQVTAEYKQRLVDSGDTLLDMTGGLGVDFWAMASLAHRAIYIEQHMGLYAASSYNLHRLLSGRDITLVNADSSVCLPALIEQYQPTLIYLDPARREDIMGAKRVYAIEDCTPNLYEVIQLLRTMPLGRLPRLVVKLSPMLDIRHTLEHLGSIARVEIISVKGEVKELLLEIDLSLIGKDYRTIPLGAIDLGAIDLEANGVRNAFVATLDEEQNATSTIATKLGRYIYEPNGALMKAGLFRLVGVRYGLDKLHQHTHLYTADTLIADFPGRIFEIEEVVPFRSSQVKTLRKRLDRCMISVRNFPLGAEALRKKLGIKDGGERMLLATTLCDDDPTLLLSRPIHI